MYNYDGPGSLMEGGTRHYDLENDAGQENPLPHAEKEARMVALMEQN